MLRSLHIISLFGIYTYTRQRFEIHYLPKRVWEDNSFKSNSCFLFTKLEFIFANPFQEYHLYA